MPADHPACVVHTNNIIQRLGSRMPCEDNECPVKGQFWIATVGSSIVRSFGHKFAKQIMQNKLSQLTTYSPCSHGRWRRIVHQQRQSCEGKGFSCSWQIVTSTEQKPQPQTQLETAVYQGKTIGLVTKPARSLCSGTQSDLKSTSRGVTDIAVFASTASTNKEEEVYTGPVLRRNDQRPAGGIAYLRLSLGTTSRVDYLTFGSALQCHLAGLSSKPCGINPEYMQVLCALIKQQAEMPASCVCHLFPCSVRLSRMGQSGLPVLSQMSRSTLLEFITLSNIPCIQHVCTCV